MDIGDMRVRGSLICSVVCLFILLIIIVIGQLIRASYAKHEIPRYWARHWILASVITADVIYLVSLLRDYSCLLAKVHVATSVAYKLSWVLLCANVLVSLFDPYILTGGKQLVVWMVFLVIVWALSVGSVFVLLKSETDGNVNNVRTTETITSGFVKMEPTTSGYWRHDTISSVLDSLDIDFNSNLLIPGPLTFQNATSVTFQNVIDNYDDEDATSYQICYTDHEYNVFDMITSMVCLFLTFCTIPALVKTVHRNVTRCFKKVHSPLSPAQSLLDKWVKRQRITSVLFLLLNSIYTACHFACFVEFYQYCYIFYNLVFALNPVVFVLSSFMLRDVRSMFINIFRSCSRQSRPGGAVNLSTEENFDTNQL